VFAGGALFDLDVCHLEVGCGIVAFHVHLCLQGTLVHVCRVAEWDHCVDLVC
jgi:hypothetical protein